MTSSDQAATLIRGGRIVTAVDDFVGDILIEGETIAAVGQDISAPHADEIDATGMLVLPGGVDPHTHLDMPSSAGITTVDDFASGTTAAAFGGTTTIVDFCTQQPGQTLPEALEMWKEKLTTAGGVIDVGFHIAITNLTYPGALDDLAGLVADGVPSFKLFLAYKGSIMVDDETLFAAMRVASREDALIMVHAENGDAVDLLVKDAIARGDTTPGAHARSRPPLVEAEATSRAVYLARLAGCALYVVHVTCAEALEPIVAARRKGWRTWGETCTQYLFIDESMLERPDFEGAKYVFTPPPRAASQHEILWAALANGDLSVVSSDHSPWSFGQHKSLGRTDFSRIPNGAPGIEDRTRQLYEFGVREGRISLNKLVELTSTNPAKLFGLYPRKGTLAPGSDADIVIFDPHRQVTVRASDPATHHSRIDYNLYEGTQLTGTPSTVLVRGKTVVRDGMLVTPPGHGRFVHRSRFAHRHGSSPEANVLTVTK
jgi:dihydropyrimidinase